MIPLKKGDYMKKSLFKKITYLIECFYSLAKGRYTADIEALNIAMDVYGKYLFVNLGEFEGAPKLMLFTANCCPDC
jgi:hypothetical protein|tara:strand:- start:680 stop:907 length:228 start_codon:yes stop_codon:yes gene_type:complete